jgi:hypothetical protein
MHCLKHLCPLLAGILGFVSTLSIAAAQETSPAPQETSQPTFIDRQYDGKTHVMVAPYIWGATVKANYQFDVPRLPRRHSRVISGNVAVGPSQYLPKLNSAAMFAVDARNGDFDIFGDAIYLNASTTASIYSSISGPFGRQFPLTVNADAHLATAIWELAAGFSLFHTHDADLSTILGVREFPMTLNASYTATVGRRGLIAPSGSLTTSDYTNDVIWGFKGRIFLDNDRLYVPYYVDYGTGTNNQSWEAYGGGGYVFDHGQSIVALWRALNYNGFPPIAHVQKMSLGGPLLGYTFNL